MLRTFENYKIVKSSYIWLLIVPLVSKVFSKIENTISFTIDEKIYEIDLVLPFSWNIFFIAALLFTVSNILFYLSAPNIVKHYKNYGDFNAQGKGIEQLKEYMTSHERMMIKTSHMNSPIIVGEEFWKIYYDRNSNLKIMRFVISFFYLLGIGLFIYILLQNIIWVFSEWM